MVFECVTPQEGTNCILLVAGAGPATDPVHSDVLQETDILW